MGNIVRVDYCIVLPFKLIISFQGSQASALAQQAQHQGISSKEINSTAQYQDIPQPLHEMQLELMEVPAESDMHVHFPVRGRQLESFQIAKVRNIALI
jgi:hypothetical protein